MFSTKFRRLFLALPVAGLLAVVASAGAAPPVQLSGAIFTTDVTGVPVNLNIHGAKEDVYLDGGPGINAPDDAAGLPAGTYTFQVTDPTGKTLLSTDAASCRQVVIDANKKTYLPVSGSMTVPISVKNHSAGDATYFVRVHCA